MSGDLSVVVLVGSIELSNGLSDNSLSGLSELLSLSLKLVSEPSDSSSELLSESSSNFSELIVEFSVLGSELLVDVGEDLSLGDVVVLVLVEGLEDSVDDSLVVNILSSHKFIKLLVELNLGLSLFSKSLSLLDLSFKLDHSINFNFGLELDSLGKGKEEGDSGEFHCVGFWFLFDVLLIGPYKPKILILILI